MLRAEGIEVEGVGGGCDGEQGGGKERTTPSRIEAIWHRTLRRSYARNKGVVTRGGDEKFEMGGERHRG